MTEEELSDCLATLLGLNPEGWKSEPAAASTKGTGTSHVRAHRAHAAHIAVRGLLTRCALRRIYLPLTRASHSLNALHTTTRTQLGTQHG